jgi:membrane protein implicated in regulation of membrane protease activity
VLATITLFILILSLLLLSKPQLAMVIFAGTAVNIAAGFWRGYRNRRRPGG